MAKFIMVGDVHLSDRAPTTRRSDYTQQILLKLDYIRSLAFNFEVDGVVFVGDIFHSKIPKNTSFKLVSALADIWRVQCETYVLPGNHDYAAQNVDTLREHPLYQLSNLPNVHLFGYGDRRQIKAGDVWLHGVREEDSVDRFVPDKRFDEPVIVVAHSALFPPGKAPEMWDAWEAWEVVAEWDRLGDRGWPLVVWYGHIHEPHGHYQVQSQRGEYMEFVNLGAISRGSLHEENHDRVPEVGLLETDPFKVTPLKLLCAQPAKEVFRYAEVERERKEEVRAADFAQSLSQVSLEVFSVEGLIQRLREGVAGPDVPRSVVERAVELVLEATDQRK